MLNELSQSADVEKKSMKAQEVVRMVTWQNRIWGLCIPMLFAIACGQGPLQQPDLISGNFQSGSDNMASTTKLDVIDYFAQSTTGLPTDTSSLATIDSSTGTTGSIYLGFSEFLNGDLIETVTRKSNGQVDTITQVANSGIVEIWTCPATSSCQSAANFKAFTGFTLAYRPDGGYVPKPDTPISNFPPPAVVVVLPKTPPQTLPPASVIAVHVIANKLSNTNNIFMDQVVNSNGDKIVTPGNSPVAGTVWFLTK